MEFGVGFFEEGGDYVGALDGSGFGFRLSASGFVGRGLVGEGGVFLVAFGGEADVVELNFVGAGLGYEFG